MVVWVFQIVANPNLCPAFLLNRGPDADSEPSQNITGEENRRKKKSFTSKFLLVTVFSKTFLLVVFTKAYLSVLKMRFFSYKYIFTSYSSFSPL
jgi:hypothetical protein